MPQWPKGPRASPKKLAIDRDLIRELVKLLDETGLAEIEIEQDGQRVRVARPASPVSIAAQPGAIAPAGATAIAVLPAAMDPADHPGVIASPMVGTAYRAAEPGDKPFVDVGTQVKLGDTLLIIEAMKVLNQIPSPRPGTVTQILFEDGQPVEFGEPLVIVE